MIPRTSRLTVRSIPLCSWWMSSFPSRNRFMISSSSRGRSDRKRSQSRAVRCTLRGTRRHSLPTPCSRTYRLMTSARLNVGLSWRALPSSTTSVRSNSGHFRRQQDAEPAHDVRHPVQRGTQVELVERLIGEVVDEVVDLRPQALRVGRRGRSEGGDRLRQPAGVAVVDGDDQRFEPVAHVLVEPADHAGVEDAEHAAVQHQVVPRVRVGVVEAVLEDHLQVDAGGPHRQVVGRHPGGWAAFTSSPRSPPAAPSSGRAARQVGDRRPGSGRRLVLRSCGQNVSRLRRSAVKSSSRFRTLRNWRTVATGRYGLRRLVVALGQLGEAGEQVEIAGHLVGDALPLHLDDDLAGRRAAGPAWTWPMDADASGTGSNSANSSSGGLPSSAMIVSRTTSGGSGGVSVCSLASSSARAGLTMSGRVLRTWPNLMNVVPSSVRARRIAGFVRDVGDLLEAGRRQVAGGATRCGGCRPASRPARTWRGRRRSRPAGGRSARFV